MLIKIHRLGLLILVKNNIFSKYDNSEKILANEESCS
jgi:hypothetical protein